jgi:metallophosphoesterase (TIGR00282 family)
MKILFFADVVGSAGRQAVANDLPKWREEYKPDLIIANAENAAHGDGVTPKVLDELIESGVQAFTTGDHFMGTDFSQVAGYPVIRPGNLSDDYPGTGTQIVETSLHQRVLLVNILGNAFMGRMQADNFFQYAHTVLEKHAGEKLEAIFIDFHAETTSETNALGRYLDGKVSALVGTHTHIPTADTRILPGGTAFQTDAGMCASLDSVIGFQVEDSYRFLRREMGEDVPKPSANPEESHPVFSDAVLVETDGPHRAKAVRRLSSRPV